MVSPITLYVSTRRSSCTQLSRFPLSSLKSLAHLSLSLPHELLSTFRSFTFPLLPPLLSVFSFTVPHLFLLPPIVRFPVILLFYLYSLFVPSPSSKLWYMPALVLLGSAVVTDGPFTPGRSFFPSPPALDVLFYFIASMASLFLSIFGMLQQEPLCRLPYYSASSSPLVDNILNRICVTN